MPPCRRRNRTVPAHRGRGRHRGLPVEPVRCSAEPPAASARNSDRSPRPGGRRTCRRRSRTPSRSATRGRGDRRRRDRRRSTTGRSRRGRHRRQGFPAAGRRPSSARSSAPLLLSARRSPWPQRSFHRRGLRTPVPRRRTPPGRRRWRSPPQRAPPGTASTPHLPGECGRSLVVHSCGCGPLDRHGAPTVTGGDPRPLVAPAEGSRVLLQRQRGPPRRHRRGAASVRPRRGWRRW